MPEIPQDLYQQLLLYGQDQLTRDELGKSVYSWYKEQSKPKQQISNLSENNLFALLDKAKAKMLFPKITVLTDTIQRGRLVAYMSKDRNKINFVDSGKYPDNQYYGMIYRTKPNQFIMGRDCSSEIRSVINTLMSDPIGLAKIHGQQYANCCFCGKLLRNKNSLTVGYGPICAENWGLPWEGTAEAARLAAIEDDLQGEQG